MSRDTRPDALTRVCLLGAAALPWYAAAAGIYALYFYVLLLVSLVGRALGGAAGNVVSDALFFATLIAALPLALWLLLTMPVGLVFAAFRYPPGGLAGRTVRGGCVVSMAFAALHAATIITAWVTGLMQGDAEGLWLWGLINEVVLLCGLAATIRSWRWLRRQALRNQKRASDLCRTPT